MKKLFLFVLTFAMILTFTACNSTKQSTTEATTTQKIFKKEKFIAQIAEFLFFS